MLPDLAKNIFHGAPSIWGNLKSTVQMMASLNHPFRMIKNRYDVFLAIMLIE